MLVTFLFLFLFLFHSSSFGQESSAYLSTLLLQSSQLQLHKERFWHLLVHYRKNTGPGYTSEIDDPGFFLAPDGKTNPQAELEATLRHFFSDRLVGRSQQPARCAFIARYEWLKEQLQFKENNFPPQTCDRFHRWLKELNPASVTLIFPSAFMNNPASMFGHTFLRIDQVGQTEQTRILAYTINFAAEVPPNPGLEYAYKGVFGGYKGFFSTIPYYLKVQEYRDIENRDIWEYRLNFSTQQVLHLLKHTWELGNAYFFYYYFKENCAYHILSLLEIADPSLHLTDSFHFWTIPSDTIRHLFYQKALISDVAYRPARSTQLKRKLEEISINEREIFSEIVHNPSTTEADRFRVLPTDRQIFLLDTASDLFRFRSAKDPSNRQEYQQNNSQLLVSRSLIPIPSSTFQVKPYFSSPELGHGTFRINTGFGWRNHSYFEEISFRAVYHDLLDPDQGYAPNAQIELGDLALRHYHHNNQLRLERFTLGNILSLSPLDSWFRSPSWKIRFEMNTITIRSCTLCSNGNFNAGIGGAFETHILQHEVFFLFGEIDANVSGAFNENHRIGGGVTAGMTATITNNWKWFISAGYLYYALGDRSDDIPISIGQRWTLGKNLAIRSTLTHHHHDNQWNISLLGYF